MPDAAWEDDLGIHFVRDKSPPKLRGDPGRCMQCGAPATCMPQLFVPCSALAINQVKAVSSLMSVTLCDKHFFDAQKTPQQFLAEPHVREAFMQQFTRRGSYPNFDKAVVGRVPASDEDYQKLATMMRRQMETP